MRPYHDALAALAATHMIIERTGPDEPR
jgi:hypothetical protein